MIKLEHIIVLLTLITLASTITGVGLNPIRPLQMNKGLSTKYMFYIDPETQISSGGQVRIVFPAEFDKTALASQLSCMASSPSNGWRTVPCLFQNQSVVVMMNVILKEQLTILVSQPTNPTIYSMSSFFSVCLLVNGMITSCDQTFGKVVFPNYPLDTNATSTYPAVSSLNSVIVGQSSTYQIQFSLSGTYSTGNTVRVTFPLGFQTSSIPICQMSGTYNQMITTFVWPDNRTIQCQNINKTLGTNETLKIIGIFNPNFGGTFGNTANGFKLQILQQTTTIVYEQIFIKSTISILPGSMTGYITQQNNFINGNVLYTFYLNLLNSLTSTNFIIIGFNNTVSNANSTNSSWILYQNQCSVISGIVMGASSNLACKNYTRGGNTYLNVSNFVSASVSNQLVFNIMVYSPSNPGTYIVNIQSQNINGTLDQMTTSVYLNSTYGDYSMLSINAIIAQSNVPVSGTGPLELTFFLNYELPQTNVLTSGVFILKIYPQIPLPNPLINGVLKCYFFNTIPAQRCSWDNTNSTNFTLVTINTPLTNSFQYSQIPITITTEGAVNSSVVGITIADIVTRYRFQLQLYQQNNSVIPTEVYFSQYIAAALNFNITYYALTKEVNQYTHFRFQFASPYQIVSPLSDDFRIKIEFLNGGGWATNLGYSPNTIYKNFPCVYSDIKNQTLPPQYNSQVQCDFYTYLTGPHASLTNATFRGPYILVSGFTNQLNFTNQVRLQLGKFLIGSTTNIATYIRFSLIQQTPSMLTKYIELYYNQFVAFTTSAQSSPTVGSGGITDTINTPGINSVSTHNIAFTAPATFFAVIYQFDQISTPSFPNQFIECTILTATNINWCTYLGYPLNYIVEYSYLTTFATTVSSKVNVTNGIYSGTFSATARVFSSASLTIMKKSFNVVYTPYSMAIANIGFSLDTSAFTTLYKGVQEDYLIVFKPVYNISDNGFIRLIFGSGIALGQNPYCTSTNIQPLVPEVGLVCTIESSTSLKVSNIVALYQLTSYQIRVRLATLITTTTTVNPTVTIQLHRTVLADPSIVNQYNNYVLSPAYTNYYSAPNQFKINNPRITFETPRVGYIGKFQTVITPTSDVLSAFQIIMTLNNHKWNGGIWTTPNSTTTDPLVCLINTVRVPCTFTLAPLTVTMSVSPAGLTAGQSNVITLDTQYMTPYNGIVHPNQGGQYSCNIQFLSNNGSVLQKQSFYHKVLPPRLKNLYINSTVNDIGVQNMWHIKFQIGSTNINANNGNPYSRMFVQFPTVDSYGNPLFANNLGGYTVTGEYVGCSFNTWTTYYVRNIGGQYLKCRLIMSQVPGDPVRVEVINHSSFSGSWVYFQFWIAKVFNPAYAVTSVPISIKIDHVTTTNDVYQLYYDTFDVYMNSQIPATNINTTNSCQYDSNCGSCTILSTSINNRGWFRFGPNAMTGINSNYGYYYAIDTTNILKPRSLQDEVNNNYCYTGSGYYDYCLTFPEINYIVVWGYTSNYYVQIYVNFGAAISQATSNLLARVWNQQRLTGFHTIQITPTCWNQLLGAFSSVSIGSTTSTNYDQYLNRRKAQVYLDFTTQNPIPLGGTIEVNFPTSIPRIYPHCRSMVNLGSTLLAQGSANYNGQIGCLVQNTRQWVITGFNAVSSGSKIVIVGLVDYPSSSGWIGAGQILSFNSTHSSNIRPNGFIIDYYYSGSFGININNAYSMNTNSRLILDEYLPLRSGNSYVGPLQFKFNLATSISGPFQGIITVRVPALSTTSQTGGFSYVSSKKHVCQIVLISTYQQTGCIITSITVDNTTTFPNYMFTMMTSGVLTNGLLYKLTITTHTGSQPQGLTFPTAPGTYKIDFNFDTTGSTNFPIHNHLYLEVYGTKFTYLQVISMVTCPGYMNLIWLKLTPTTTIYMTQQIVIQIPTVSSNGNPLFANGLGATYSNGTAIPDGAIIPIDILAGSFAQGFMSCNLFYGDSTNNKPAKIVCGGFTSTITSSQLLFFAFKVKNPSSYSGTQISIPFFIYSQQQGTAYKSNFDVIENAVFLRNDVYSYSDVGQIQSQYQQLQTSNVYLTMISRNVWSLNAGDYYVMFFGFPIRNNGQFVSACTYPGNYTYGDAYYHQNLWVVVCAITTTTNTLSTSSGGSTTKNLRISNFYTPFYYLSASQQAVTVYSYSFARKITGIYTLNDKYPNEGPKTSANTAFTLTPLHQTGTQYIGSRDDYTVTFTYANTATVDLSFVQLIAIIFPNYNGIDYSYPQSDCLQSPASQVEIASCYIDTTNGVIWVTPVIKSTYTSNLAISIITRNLAIRNPVNNYVTNANQFVIYYYSWQNISKPTLSPLSNQYYAYLMINNFNSAGISYSKNPSPYQVPSFTYIKYPHQKYYTETPFSSLTHRAPFEMLYMPIVNFSAIANTSSFYNAIQIQYVDCPFGDANMVLIKDLQVFRPVCYLNNQRIKKCELTSNNVTKIIRMSFQFALSAYTTYHLKFSLLDSRNADVDGFLPISAVSSLIFIVRPYAIANGYTQTDQFPTLLSLPTGITEGPFRGIIAGTAVYGHTVPNQLNFVTLKLTFNRTDITGLVFQIPSFDKNNNALFTYQSNVTNTFLNQQNGGSYPCGNNGLSAGGNVRCFLLNGDYVNLGVPTRILMTGFTYGTSMNCRFPFINPANSNTYFSVLVKAFGGTPTASNPYGNQYMGQWQFNEIFMVGSSPTIDTNTYVANNIKCPSQSSWRNNTIAYVFSKNTQIPATRSTIAVVTLNDSTAGYTDSQICEATLDPTNAYDDLMQYSYKSGSATKKIAYFVRTWPNSQDISANTGAGWGLSYLKCKFYVFDIVSYNVYGDTSIEIATNQFQSPYCNGFVGTAPKSVYFSQDYIVNNSNPVRLVHEFDITPTFNSITNFNFRNGDAMVLSIRYSYNYWGTITSCSLLGGIISTSIAQAATCGFSGSDQMYISNVGGFMADPLLAASKSYRVKILFTGSGLINATYSNFYFYAYLYANYDAYTNGYQPIFLNRNWVGSSLGSSSCYRFDPTNCYYGQTSGQYGTFQVQLITDTFMRVAFSPSGNPNFNTGTNWGHYFTITTNGFSYGPSCTVSNVVFEYSSSTTPGSGYNNTYDISTATCSLTKIELIFQYKVFNTWWGGVGSASDNTFNAGSDFIIFYITISPDTSNKDLPSMHHEYLFVQGAYNYYDNNNGSYNSQTQRSVNYAATSLATSATISTLSTNRGGVTQFSFTLSQLTSSFGPANTGYYLLAQFLSTSGWTAGNEPFATYTNTAVSNDFIACKCIAGTSPLTVSASSAIVDTVCVRRIPSGSFTNYAILIQANAAKTQDLICYFPEFKIATSMSFNVEFKLVYGDAYPPELSTVTTKYSSLYRVSSNTLTFSGSTPTMTLTGFSSLTQTPNFYANANGTNVGSTLTGSYTLSGSWSSGLSSPYIYINFMSAGPIPIYSFCSDSNTFLQCRVYSNYINVIVAQLKSTSATSFSLSNSGIALLYPKSQFSVSSSYNALIYVGVGQWQYSTTITRTQSSLTPIAASFYAFSDQYGSKFYTFSTNLFFSLNPTGQYLYNYATTGSMLVISWTATITTTTNCQVWVQNEPAVNLQCFTSTKSLIVISRYFDYSTVNNIFVSIGLTNPLTATTFTAKLYSFYFSSGRYALTVSTTTTYTANTKYSSVALIPKSTVSIYPFKSRISSVANAPMRIQFALPSSSVATANGAFTLTYSQIQYSATHLCYIIAYASYTAMIQQTQRVTYKATCTSTLGQQTITVVPPPTLTLVYTTPTPTYYQLVMMPLSINAAGCTAYGCVTQSGYQQLNFDFVNFIAYNNINSPGVISQQVNRVYNYEGSYYIGLQHIYVLCTQPVLTSIYLSININFTSNYNFPSHYLEVTFYDLQITAFVGYSIGGIIPCQLSSNFLSITNRQAPQCRVVMANLLNSFVTVRIQNIGFLTPQLYWMTLDDILLPAPSQLGNNQKFDIAIGYYGPSNVKYWNYFPQIFQIDNTNLTTPVTSSSYTYSNPPITGYGVPVTGQFQFTWPFVTTSRTTSWKIAMNFNGGYSSIWNSINAITFVDVATSTSWNILWVNTKLNKFIFEMPSKTATATTIQITNLVNPYPYQRQLYNFNSTNIIINFYNNFFLANMQTFAQPAFNLFTQNPSLIYINQNYPCNTMDYYPANNTFSPGSLNVILLSIEFDESPSNMQARNLNNLQIKFTSGLSSIKQCRTMRNNSQFYNPQQVCQPYYDGTNWWVKLYDVANSNMTLGWWVQIFATFNGPTLIYTSYSISALNGVVQYQNSYTITLSGYNSGRTIPTTLTWLNNKYVTTFFETQYKFLQAVASQKTQYIKFRFSPPITSSTSSDNFYITLPGNSATQPYSPVNNNLNVIGQFLPALSPGDNDYSVGMFAEGSVSNSGGKWVYTFAMRYGGLVQSYDYLIQISEYNTANSSFYMSTSPNRQQITFQYQYYPSLHNWKYYDTFYVLSYSLFRSAQFLHTTTTVNDYETLTINYTPYGNLAAASSSNQIALRVSVEAFYHLADGGIGAIYTADGKSFGSGTQFSGVVSNPNGAQVTTIQIAQYAIDNSPLRFVLAKQSAYTDNTAYYFIVPLIQIPNTAYITLRYNITLVNSPSGGYQYIFNHYQSLNEYYTVADTSTSFTTSINNNLRAVQSGTGVDLSVNLNTYTLNQWNTAIFKVNNALTGLLSSLATPNDTSNYNYYYFKVINMVMAQKKTSTNISTIGIGSLSATLNYQSTFGFSWVRVFNNSNVPLTYNPYTLLYSTPPSLTLTYLTSYAASSLSLVEGYQTQGSTAMYQVTFTTPIIPQGGQIRILFDNNTFTSYNGGSCRVLTNFVRSSNAYSVLRCYRVSQGFRIVGFSPLAASTSVSAYFMLKSIASATNSSIQADIFGIYQSNSTRIALANVGTITHTSGSVPPSLYRFEQMVIPYFSSLHSNNYYMIEGTFNLRVTTLTSGDYIYISEPGWADSSGTRRFLIKQNTTSVTGWTELLGYNQSANYYRFTIPPTYNMSQSATISIQYLFRYTVYFTNAAYNGFVSGGTGVSRFWISTYRSASSAYQEVGYFDFIPYPYPSGLTINNRYPAAGKATVMDLSIYNNIDIDNGTSVMTVTFDTHNLLYPMFANDLENLGTNGTTYRYLDCTEWEGQTQISTSRIVCLLHFGNSQTSPPTPANLTISFQSDSYGFSTPQVIRILIANVVNPSTVGMNVGIKVNVDLQCQNQQDLPCSGFQSRGIYVTTSSSQNLQVTSTTFASSSSLVLTTGLTHTFTLTLTSSITTTSAIYIVYPQNYQGLMPQTCTVSNYYCYVFPTRRWVVLFPKILIASGTITLAITSMNNPYYSQALSKFFLVTVARAGVVGDYYQILQNPMTPVTYSFQSTNTSTSMTVLPTQTPSMFLRNYANTVNFTINNLFSDPRTQAIYIQAPVDVTVWDTTYCNASITNTSNYNYPLRFTCMVDPVTPSFLRLTRDSDMKTFNPMWGTMSICLHAKFTLADFSTPPTLYVTTPVTSSPFYAYSSVSPTTSSSIYYMSTTSVTISISQNQVPIISTINFNTQSFANRQALVNSKQVFYMLFKPLVNVNIGSIVFTIPSQFNYPSVFNFDNCLMVGRTTINQPNCVLSRSNGQTLVTLTPNNYDNTVKIFQIGTVSQANWFTSPSLPGNFYNMNVAIYSTTGALISKKTSTISPVYGASLFIPNMTIANIQDANTKLGLYDIQFVTGSLQIPPGASTTATTQTSQLQFIFQNFNGMNGTDVFSNDLGTGLSNGDEIGCRLYTGLTALSGLRMKCLLSLGTNSTNKPKIIVINYNFINPYTTIKIGFASIQTLPPVLTNTISVGAVIFYTNIGSSTYLYVPTPILTVATNATVMANSFQSGWSSGWLSNATYYGTNIVLQPTIFTVSFRIPYWYSINIYGSHLYDYVYSSTGADDQFILMTFYPHTLLDKNNPLPVSCVNCTSVDVFYASGTVRFRHTKSFSWYTSNIYYNYFSFTNFPTSAYAMNSQTVYVYFQIFDQYQAIYSNNITVTYPRTVEQCTKFTFGVISVSSLNGGQIGVTYLFSVVTNHFIPADGAFSITIPIQYGDMIANGATCTLIGFSNTNCYCSIKTPSRIDIYANGTELSTTTTYSIKITGLQNPNIASSNFVFIVASYYVSNIYLGLTICQNSILPPSINIKPLRTCTLSWTPQYYNQNYNASYVFQLSCSDVFRGDSILYISLPSAYSTSNKIGSFPCSSYESTTLVTPTCKITNINGVFTLTTSIDASSQSSLSLLINLVNPINNTYYASAYVTSKGTQYASSTNSSITILANSYSLAKVSDVSLLNMPKQAGLMSTYVFQIAPISSFSPSNLGITFPSNFYIDSTKVKVSILNTAQNNFFSQLTYNNIQSLINNVSSVNNLSISSFPNFTVTSTSVYLTNIQSQVVTTQWTYVFVSNIQNPSSYVYANFTVTYYLISNGFQALQWIYQYPLTYYISPPPGYISIKSVSVTDLDLLYPANYTFAISGSNGSVIGVANKTLSYIIVIPTFYSNTLWANTAPICKFSILNVTSSCYSYQGQIIITQKFATNQTSLIITISTMLNPSLPTQCNTTDVTLLSQTFFIIRIIDPASNTFLFQTSSIVDSTNCLTFSAIRIPISLEYSLVMTAGLAYNITYGLTKPASNLKITAVSTNSGLTFSPATIDFNDYYTLTKSTQLFLRSDVASGTYFIYFNKSQSSSVTYFRNILPIKITVTAASATTNSQSPTISISSMVDSTIGYPVNIPVQFSLPSSTQMTLFLTISQQSNQTLAQYSPYLSNFTITPRIVNIMPQNTTYSFVVTHGKQVVPPPLTLNFKLTSNYPIVHVLTTPTMYLCFDRDPRYNVLYPPMRVTVTQFLTSCNLQDVGKNVTNVLISNLSSQSSATSVTPKIISLQIVSVASTGGIITINTISSGTVYFACQLAGYPAITNATLLVNQNVSKAVTGTTLSNSQAIQSGKTAQINYLGTITIANLTQQTNYILYAVLQNNLGISAIQSISFKTTGISRGVQFRLSFTSVVDNLLLVNSLVQALRVSPLRIKILTSSYTLQKQQSSVSSNDNQPKYTYDIVLAPDAANDIISPLTTISSFATSTSALQSFSLAIPTFSLSTKITYYELRPIYPKLNGLPKTASVRLYNATFNITFWTQSKVYAIILEQIGASNNSLANSEININPVLVSTLSSKAKQTVPTSAQVKAGTDNNNKPLGKYKIVQVLTDETGFGQIVFTDLKSASFYQVFITASSPLPYEPTMLWPDSQVLTFSFSTLPNPNVGKKEDQQAYIDQLKKYNPALADAMSNFVKMSNSKSSTKSK